MKYARRLIKYVGLAILALTVFPSIAYAYLDPGTGSYIFQVVIGALLGSVFAIKMFWRNIKKFFANLFSKEKTEEE